MYSTVTGEPIDGATLRRRLLGGEPLLAGAVLAGRAATVRAGSRDVPRDQPAPGPVERAARGRRRPRSPCAPVPSMRRDQGGRDSVLASLGALYTSGQSDGLGSIASHAAGSSRHPPIRGSANGSGWTWRPRYVGPSGRRVAVAWADPLVGAAEHGALRNRRQHGAFPDLERPPGTRVGRRPGSHPARACCRRYRTRLRRGHAGCRAMSSSTERWFSITRGRTVQLVLRDSSGPLRIQGMDPLLGHSGVVAAGERRDGRRRTADGDSEAHHPDDIQSRCGE